MPHIHLEKERTYERDYVIRWRRDLTLDEIKFIGSLYSFKMKQLKQLCKEMGCRQTYQGYTNKDIIIQNIIANKLYGVKSFSQLKCEPENLVWEIAMKLEKGYLFWFHPDDSNWDNDGFIPLNPIRN